MTRSFLKIFIATLQHCGENGTNDTIRVFTRLRSSGCARTKLFCTSTHRLIYKEDSIYRAVWCEMQQVSKAWVSGLSVPPRHFQCLVKYAKIYKHLISSFVLFPSITSSFQKREATKTLVLACHIENFMTLSMEERKDQVVA